MLSTTRIITVLLILLSISVSATEKNYKLTLSAPDKPVKLDVDLYYGSIEIVGYEGKEVEVSIDTIAKKKDENLRPAGKANSQSNNKARSRDGLKKIDNNASQVSIRESNNQVSIQGERSEEFVVLTIKVPKNTSVDAQLYRGGEINIDDVLGELELQTWKASITAKNVNGPIVAETYDAQIIVEFTQFSEQNPSSIASHSGDIDVTLNAKANAKLNIQNYKGDIFSGLATEFVSQDKVERSADRQGQEIVVGNMLTTTLNSGNQTLTVVSYSGDFYIRQ